MLVIDRFEADFAIIEYEVGEVFLLPRFLLPTEAKEGDVLSFNVVVDVDETAKRREQVRLLLDDLFKKNREN